MPIVYINITVGYMRRHRIRTFENEQRGRRTPQPRCCVSAYISVVILTPILKPSMKASFSDRAISITALLILAWIDVPEVEMWS